MDVLFLIGRIVFALVFLFSGATVHLLQAGQGIAYARTYRVPAAALLVPLSGVIGIVSRGASKRKDARWRCFALKLATCDTCAPGC